MKYWLTATVCWYKGPLEQLCNQFPSIICCSNKVTHSKDKSYCTMWAGLTLWPRIVWGQACNEHLHFNNHKLWLNSVNNNHYSFVNMFSWRINMMMSRMTTLSNYVRILTNYLHVWTFVLKWAHAYLFLIVQGYIIVVNTNLSSYSAFKVRVK